ncbi:Ribosomal RNA large subunit methyltransferase E [Desulfovibrionales bacterium]
MKNYRDHYFVKAKQDGYVARSVYKLKELDTQYRLFRPGQRILDLGAAPGSWTLYAAAKVAGGKALVGGTQGERGKGGWVLAVDLQDWAALGTTFPDNVTCLTDDVLEPSQVLYAALSAWRPFDLVISDMAPRTTGVRVTDQTCSLALAEAALKMAGYALVTGGHFIVKIFMGPDVKAYVDILCRRFATVKAHKPKSSRSESIEIFYVGFFKR